MSTKLAGCERGNREQRTGTFFVMTTNLVSALFAQIGSEKSCVELRLIRD